MTIKQYILRGEPAYYIWMNPGYLWWDGIIYGWVFRDYELRYLQGAFDSRSCAQKVLDNYERNNMSKERIKQVEKDIQLLQKELYRLNNLTEKTYKFGDVLVASDARRRAVITRFNPCNNTVVFVDPEENVIWNQRCYMVKNVMKITRVELDSFGFKDWNTV